MSTFTSPLAEKSLEFAIELVTHMRPVKGCGAIKDQLLRAGTSIGANIREAQYGYSSDDFVFKLQTALKECNETGYWLDVVAGAQLLPPDIVKNLRYKRNRIHRMLTASLNTKKANLGKGVAPIISTGASRY